MNITIVIATHKKNQLPNDSIYLPLHVGKEGKEDIGYIGDNTGDNISIKNPYFCELTGIYWAWKNLNADFIGLVHYRRYFSLIKSNAKWDSLLSSVQAQSLCSAFDVILPKKRKYYIETLFSHYSHTHDKEHLLQTKAVLKDLYPDYIQTFDLIMNKRSAHMFNMFIMKKDYFRSYCEWLFPILFELEKRITYKDLTPYESRLFGRISELLLDVWIERNQIDYKEVNCVHLGKINWGKKIISFLIAKFGLKKYNTSF